MSVEQQPIINKEKGSGLKSLVIFSLVAFVVCFTGIYLLTFYHNKKLNKNQLPQHISGFFDVDTYYNPYLGWKITFPKGMTLLDQSQIKSWHRLPQIPGFDAEKGSERRLFLAIGNSFSVVAMAWAEPLPQVPAFYTRDQIIVSSQEKLRQSVQESTRFDCNWEVTEVIIDGQQFKRLDLTFFYNGEEQKRQTIFSTIINDYLLNVTVVYYNPVSGMEMNEAIMASEFEKQKN